MGADASLDTTPPAQLLRAQPSGGVGCPVLDRADRALWALDAVELASGKGAMHRAKPHDGPSRVAAGDHRAMADLWFQFLRPLPHSRRLGVLVEFFKLLPKSYRNAIMWSITSPRVLKSRSK